MRFLAHITKKRHERIAPLVADKNPATPIIPETRMVLPGTTRDHVLPRDVLSCFREPVLPATTRAALVSQEMIGLLE
jgi:hypothetical protein